MTVDPEEEAGKRGTVQDTETVCLAGLSRDQR